MCESCFTCELSSQPGPPPGGGGSVFTAKYFDGFNLNFELTKEQAEALMPSSDFSPLALSLDTNDGEAPLTSEDLDQSSSCYYLTWYVANTGVKIGDLDLRLARADLFTYTLDAFGELSHVFLAAIVEVPEAFSSPDARPGYEAAVESFAQDSRTGMTAFPHYFTESFHIYDDGFDFTLNGETVGVSTAGCNSAQSAFLSREFLLISSQVYRSPVDKYNNYYNKDLILAPVKRYKKTCVEFQNSEGWAALNPVDAAFAYLSAFGRSDVPITWQFEDAYVAP
jgi:hypothetical protein